MIDQVVIATDANLTVLYSNYHEKLYKKIMKKVEHIVNLEIIRSKLGVKLDKCFMKNKNTLETDSKTMRVIMKMFESINFDPNNDATNRHYQDIGIYYLLLTLQSHQNQIRMAIERKSLKQINIENRRSQNNSMQLIVNRIK